MAKKNEVIEDAVVEEVDVTTDETNEEAKISIWQKAKNGIVKVATSKPVKIIGGAALVAGGAIGGYFTGKKAGIKSIDIIDLDAINDVTDAIDATVTEI